MTIAALEHNFKPFSTWVKVPILIAGEQSSTTVEPAKGLREELIRTEQKEGIMAASYLMGFPWSDNKDSSVSVYVVAYSQELANKEALRLAEHIWNTRNDFCFQTETYSEEETLNVAFQAIANGQKLPIYLSDSGDNPTAGSSSDCTGFLKLMLDDPRTANLKTPILYGGIYDPEATLACKGKVGQEITLTFGAKFDTITTQPITATGTVLSYIENWDKASTKTDLALFRTQGVDIVLAETHVGYTTPAIFSDLGRNPADADIVVCKLGYLTAAQAAVAKRSIMALSKGSTNEDLKTLPYTKIPRPIFPLDTDIIYNAKENLILKENKNA
jgi:microcystin degradation protein MlrC